jgi:hypothetical protein
VREREAVRLQELQEGALETTERDRLAAEDRPEVLGTFAVRSSRKDRFDVFRFRSVEDACLMPRSAELVLGERASQVDESAGDRGCGDAVEDGDVAWIEVAIPLHLDSLDASFVRRDHFRRRRSPPQQPHQMAGSSARQDGSIASREHRREIGRLGAWS